MHYLFSNKFESMVSSLKYLGYFSKPNNYREVDSLWVIKKVKAIINDWCNRWISLGECLILVKFILESIPMYWLSLAHVPNIILSKIMQRCFNFMWLGGRKREGFPLVKWKILVRPKKEEGWTLKIDI